MTDDCIRIGLSPITRKSIRKKGYAQYILFTYMCIETILTTQWNTIIILRPRIPTLASYTFDFNLLVNNNIISISMSIL